MAIVFCGMVLSRYGMASLSSQSHQIVMRMATTVAKVFEEVAFLIIGIAVFGVAHKYDRIDLGTVLVNFAFLCVSRFLSISVVWGIVSLLRIKRISRNFQTLILLSGIRGAMCWLTSVRSGRGQPVPLLRGRVPDSDGADDRHLDVRLWPADALAGPALPGREGVRSAEGPTST